MRQEKIDYWKDHVNELNRSGLGVPEYAAARGMRLNTLRYYKWAVESGKINEPGFGAVKKTKQSKKEARKLALPADPCAPVVGLQKAAEMMNCSAGAIRAALAVQDAEDGAVKSDEGCWTWSSYDHLTRWFTRAGIRPRGKSTKSKTRSVSRANPSSHVQTALTELSRRVGFRVA